MPATFNRDRLMSAPATAVASATMGLLDALQKHPVETQALASAALFTLLRDHLRLDVHDTMAAVQNLLVSRDGARNPAFEAARLYLAGEGIA